MKILITGGAGYIGSHTLRQFLNTKHELFVLDNLSKGSSIAINDLQKLKNFNFIKQDLSDFKGVKELFKKEKFDAVVHFAASIEVFESMQNPLKYYMNNTINTTNLIHSCLEENVNNFIFSSTAATYGEPKTEIVSETSTLQPINPYGRSKLMSEEVLRDASKAKPEFKHCILRYFNVAGACMDFDIGQRYDKATLLIKVAAECAAGKRDKIFIFGDDYNTRDGTCIRDYIHVDDISSAHLAGLEYLQNNESSVFNVGYGHGFSVKEVIETMKMVSGVDFKVEISQRRPGDPSILISNANKIKEKTSWKPKFDDLKLICKSAYEWELKLIKEKNVKNV
ncbi:MULTISPECIES: UDP-glucose 4-epimerase GalE [unclassified Campylobacter]|uniref:UDP-glucose 4-epimerase GalE n=1 Tax=unclassified Campylobacter TaxID=2593542 RepID=UPI001237B3BA|nr:MULTISPECIES: UDP-glucose 4-epimerase GalE [unclassified Campylobacter]KAA6224667.1 UDP-glucose 4-epimerase GalE [Campylobacter sp. LR185c]KAA6225667.1 UDP-glucose 4-epimerase GalE [Campylobacter sp. LR286c]KAA6225787.1 UDP-glucose 4-epimerase GalE [Campylobacter sp. LR196d]KAA6229640.1 UDP-glucose 4-epimerase GalE [Campylobacter sp. LR291e]KAA8603991.1 UDP-glucose 4-epimerase GalE [Campylobacter sp. LR185c]